MTTPSLRRRIILLLLPALAVLLAINALFTYQGARNAVNLAYDRALQAAARSIAERTFAVEGKISVDIPYSALEIFDGDVQERIFYAVLGPRDELLTGYDDLRTIRPQLPAVPGLVNILSWVGWLGWSQSADQNPNDSETRISYFDAHFRQDEVRVALLVKRLYDPSMNEQDRISVLFAETTEARRHLVAAVFYSDLRRQLGIVCLGGLLAFLAFRSGFRPLLRLRDTIRQREVEDLTPLPTDAVPSEVLPLIDAANFQMNRLATLVESRKRFLADAFHQLRTPLAVLTTQVDYALRQTSADDKNQTLTSMQGSLRGAKRMTEQILSLSSADMAKTVMTGRLPVDLAALATQVVTEGMNLALAKDIDLGLELPEAAILVLGNEVMLHELIANLVDNAVRYTPRHGTVTVALRRDQEFAVLEVLDTGPGIPETERENVFKRFYRLKINHDVVGSGLGLSIAREISLAHGGTIELAANEASSLTGHADIIDKGGTNSADQAFQGNAPNDKLGCGLCVRVRMPAVAPTPPASQSAQPAQIIPPG